MEDLQTLNMDDSDEEFVEMENKLVVAMDEEQ